VKQYDFIICRWRVGGLRARQPAERRPVGARVGARGRPARLPLGRVHPHAGGVVVPIGSRFYDWQYESEPEPYMNGRRIYHARGKVLGGSSSINGMIFQRGNPLDLERWAADPGLAEWSYAHCLPYFKRMETCLAGVDEFRGGSGPLELERGPATNPLCKAFFESVQQAGYELTDDVNGYRQEGFARFDRNIRRARRLSAAGAYLHPVMNRPNLEVKTPRAHDEDRVRRHARRRCRVHDPRAGANRGGASSARWAARSSACGGAFNSPQLLQLSASGTRPT
jgi:choline dehydrogenase